MAVGAGRGGARALFLVPGGGSTPFYLTALARRLEGTAVFGLQPRGLDGEAPPHQTVEETAAWYAGAIRSVQPEGPYFVGGHSVGGHVAYEIAQQLKEQGHEIGLVALLDTVAPFPEATRPMGQGWDVSQWLVQIAGVMEGFFNVEVGLGLDALRGMDEAARFETFVMRLTAAGILPPGAGPSHVMGILNVARAQDAHARVDVRRALELLNRRAEVPEEGLQDRLPVRLVPHHVGGVARVAVHGVRPDERLAERDRLVCLAIDLAQDGR